MIFKKNNKNENIKFDTVKKDVISKREYRIIGHSAEFSLGEYTSTVAVRDEEGKLKHFELEDCSVDESVENIVGSYLEVITYSNESYSMRLFTLK